MLKKRTNSRTKSVVKNEIDYRQLSMMQQAIFDGANYSIISTDVNGTITSFNNAASEMLGYSAEELIGQHTPSLFHDADEVFSSETVSSRVKETYSHTLFHFMTFKKKCCGPACNSHARKPP